MTVSLAYEEYDIGALTWPEAESAIPEAEFLILPMGSIEQHSHHLPVTVDTLRAENLTRTLTATARERDLTILRLPTLPYGYSEHHSNFPGTITLDADTYQSVLEQIGRSVAAHGGNRLILANFHGGNKEPSKLAADRIQRDHDLATYPLSWTSHARSALEDEFGDEWGHAGDHETSAIEHFHPDLVRTDRKVPQTRRARYDDRQYTYFEELTAEGGLGDPTNSDAEFFASIIEETNQRIVDVLKADLETAADVGEVDPALPESE